MDQFENPLALGEYRSICSLNNVMVNKIHASISMTYKNIMDMEQELTSLRASPAGQGSPNVNRYYDFRAVFATSLVLCKTEIRYLQSKNRASGWQIKAIC